MKIEEVFAKAREAIKYDLPFVLYRMPDSSTVKAIVQKDSRLDFLSDFKESGFVMSPFDQSRQTIVFKDENSVCYSAELGARVEYTEVSGLSKRESDFSVFEKEKHLNLVKKGLEGIKNSHFEKVVLSRSEEVRINENDKIMLFSKLMDKYSSAFVYLWYHPKIGYWTGASPETLIKVRANTFTTMSLAGTQQDLGQEVLWEDKEIREQQIVTDHLLQSLKGLPLQLSPRYTKKAGNLLHLCNDIHGELSEEVGLDKLLPLLHPTAAVCGYPKKSAQDFILTEEKYDRSYYTGFLGELDLKTSSSNSADLDESDRETNLFVNLRCMQLKTTTSQKAIIYVGGGITSESDPDKEWKETVDKSLVMKSVLQD